MKYTISAALTCVLAARNAAAHATFQDLWVDGTDYGTSCARIPLSNSPVTDVTSTDLACNAGTSPVTAKCSVTAGSTVTVEMHQQPNDRSASNEAIGGAHYGPVLVYMAAVDDATSAVGSDSAWFKVFQDTWASAGSSGSDDNWGTKDLNTCGGKMDVVIPADIAPGDYLIRAEAIALHTAGSEGGAQFYMTCYQVTVTGSGTAVADTVSFPGAYAASDAGILINIYQSMTTYVAPGPTVVSGGSTKSAGAPCANCESTCTPGSTTASAGSGAAATSAVASALASSAATATAASSSAVATSSAASSQVVVAAQATTLVTSTASSSAAAVAATSATSSAAAVSSSESSCKRRRSRAARNL
ncbi:hypothetical protein VSDG_05498 [Cytospora chrysosperma]|uniref:lytic cellulose monooxygenase (C4-dehydrogenating) n=1 Tax=Cytospora chrysosperma TaxID=252740 RepID=A0A423VZE5_CYTCH|nr:hypothetical protein VSDG_05498 [Valsa sordida]